MSDNKSSIIQIFVSDTVPDCELRSQHIYNDYWNETSETWIQTQIWYKFDCLQFHPFYAVMTVFFIFFPGVGIFAGISEHFHTMDIECYSKWMILLLIFPFCIVLTPIIIVVSKLRAIFPHNDDFEKMSRFLARQDVIFETMLQLCLQIFVIYRNANIYPSPFQLFTIISSALALNLPCIQTINLSKIKANLLKPAKSKWF